MSHEERNTLAAIAVNLAVNIFMACWLWQRFGAGYFGGGDGLMLWARTVLWAIPASILLTIFATILVNIAHAIATFDGDPDFTVDERDRLYRIRAMGVTMVVVAAGFIAAMLALAFGWPALPVFTITYFSFALGDLAGNLVKFLSYRFGG